MTGVFLLFRHRDRAVFVHRSTAQLCSHRLLLSHCSVWNNLLTQTSFGNWRRQLVWPACHHKHIGPTLEILTTASQSSKYCAPFNNCIAFWPVKVINTFSTPLWLFGLNESFFFRSVVSYYTIATLPISFVVLVVCRIGLFLWMLF